MSHRFIAVLGLVSVAMFALWLEVAGPDRMFGIDSGSVGFALLVATAWGALYLLYRMPRGDLDAAIAPGEWRAWIGSVFIAQLTIYLLLKSHVFSGAPLLGNPAASAVGRNVVLLLIAWIVVSSLMGRRWVGQVQEDERDRRIAGIASGWGTAALIFSIFGLIVTLGLSPAEKLAWAHPVTVAHMLIFALLWGGLVEHLVSAILYWHDRR